MDDFQLLKKKLNRMIETIRFFRAEILAMFIDPF